MPSSRKIVSLILAIAACSAIASNSPKENSGQKHFWSVHYAADAAMASDFPGEGSPGDWSQALPYYNRGNRYMNQGRYSDAVNDYKTAISYYETDPDFYTNLGVALRKLEDYSGAEASFRRAAQLNPNDWVVWSDLANACLKQNRLSETVLNFKRALKYNPPAAEKAAMEKDIADITKIMKMQQPPAPGGIARRSAQQCKWQEQILDGD
jgi:tetratricopeptide (TPR) repeat protein